MGRRALARGNGFRAQSFFGERMNPLLLLGGAAAAVFAFLRFRKHPVTPATLPLGSAKTTVVNPDIKTPVVVVKNTALSADNPFSTRGRTAQELGVLVGSFVVVDIIVPGLPLPVTVYAEVQDVDSQAFLTGKIVYFHGERLPAQREHVAAFASGLPAEASDLLFSGADMRLPQALDGTPIPLVLDHRTNTIISLPQFELTIPFT